MSRETYELSKEAYELSLFGKGPGDPDKYGLPGEQIVHLVYESQSDKPF